MSFQHPARTRTGHQGSTPSPLASPSFPSRPGASTLKDGRSEGSSGVDKDARRCQWIRKDKRSRLGRRSHLTTFDMIPDDVLLEIFDFYVYEDMGDSEVEYRKKQRTEGWITLVHVGRRWRSVVFQSPLRLNLRLLCTPRTLAREFLDIWPPLPLIIYDEAEPLRADDMIAAFEHNDRVCQINLMNLSRSHFTDPVLQMPFPELTDLQLRTRLVGNESGPILPDSFLGRTTPLLRSLIFWGIPFPGLPKLLMSTTHLVNLDLSGIPHSGYIPPEAMATSLSTLTNLESLCLHFRYPRPRPAPERRRPLPLTRSVLPNLTQILFKGNSEYLEILAWIDAPRLNLLHITFFNQITFDTSQLFQFLSRTPTLSVPQEGSISFRSNAADITFPPHTSTNHGELRVRILCRASGWQLSSLEQVCTSYLPPVPILKDLYISECQYTSNTTWKPHWQDDVENMQWLELLHPFAAVKNLYICEEFVPRIAPALGELVGGRTTEVLPSLENIFLGGRFLSISDIEKFAAARRLTSHPVAVSQWDGVVYRGLDWHSFTY